MSNKMKVSTRQKLEVVPFSKKMVRGAAAGEIAANHGCGEAAVRCFQEAALKGYARGLEVHGIDKNGHVRQSFRLTLDASADGEIFLENDGRKTVVERIDPSLARALEHSKAGFKRRGLTADPRVVLRDDIESDAGRRAQVFKELDLREGAALRYRDGEEAVEVMKITPAKDRGSSVHLETSRKRRR